MEEDKKENGGYESVNNALVGLIENDFNKQKHLKSMMKKDGSSLIETIEDYMVQKWHFRDNEKSRVFVKITKTKVLASFGQIIEVLFSQGKFPLGFSPTSVTRRYCRKSTSKIQTATATNNNLDPYGFNGDGATFHQVLQ